MSYFDVARRVWRHKWEALVTTIGIVITLVVEAPSVPVFLLWLGLVLLLVADIVQDLRQTYQLMREKHLPFVVVAGISDDQLRAMTDDVLEVMRRWGFDERTYRDEFNVARSDWLVRRPRDLPLRAPPWIQLVDDFERKINSLASRLEGKEVFHLFLNCPAALGMAIGATLRTNYVLVLHHHAGGKYHPVVNLDHADSNDAGLALLTQHVAEPYKYIEVHRPAQLTSPLLVSLCLARHDPRGDVAHLAEQRGLAALHITNTYDNRLGLNEDWIRVAREVIGVLLSLGADPLVKRIELYLSAPLVLATAIGMGVGTQTAVTVHHWFADQQDYRPIFDLEKL